MVHILKQKYIFLLKFETLKAVFASHKILHLGVLAVLRLVKFVY